MLYPSVDAKLKDPAVKQAILFWVGEVVKMMAQVKSEKAIKLWLRKKFGRITSEKGIDYIVKLAQIEFEYQKQTRGTNQQN